MSRAVIAVVLGLVLAACGAAAVPNAAGGEQSGATTTAATVAPTTAQPTIEPPPEYELASCGSTPPVAFAVLCETFEDVNDYYVDPPDPAALAAAAGLGLASVESGTGDPPRDGFSCHVPDEAFVSLCDAIARRSVEAPAPLSELVTGAVEGMFQYGLDPFSIYVPGSVFEGPFDDTGLVYELGLAASARDASGAICGPISESCRLEVISVFDFSAAATGGLAEGDVIVEVDGEPVQGLSAVEAVSMLSGSPGTSVTLELDRRGSTLTRSLVREDIRFVPSEWDFLDGGIAYFRMNDFSQQAAIDLGAFLQSDEVAASRALVLDLRDNPGGLVLAAQAVASQFLGDGLVMVERGREYADEIPVVQGGLATSGLPLVVLVNQASASAAEIVAAVLQERGRAIVVGQPTFGKNLVQWVSETRDGGEVRITIARWETPGGLDIGIRGLAPDVEVASDPSTDVDEVLEVAIDLLS